MSSEGRSKNAIFFQKNFFQKKLAFPIRLRYNDCMVIKKKKVQNVLPGQLVYLHVSSNKFVPVKVRSVSAPVRDGASAIVVVEKMGIDKEIMNVTMSQLYVMKKVQNVSPGQLVYYVYSNKFVPVKVRSVSTPVRNGASAIVVVETLGIFKNIMSVTMSQLYVIPSVRIG